MNRNCPQLFREKTMVLSKIQMKILEYEIKKI